MALRNRSALARGPEGDEEVPPPPPPPLSVRLAGGALALSALLIAVGVVWIFLEGSDDVSGVRLGTKRTTRKPRPTTVSRFWNELWHGKRPVNASADGMVAEVFGACRVNNAVPFVDLKLQIRWATGMKEITQHRTVQCLLPSQFERQVREVWNLCTFAAMGQAGDGIRLRCKKNSVFYEVGAGAAALAMAARGMRVVVDTTMREAGVVQELQCANGRRSCRRMWTRKARGQAGPPAGASQTAKAMTGGRDGARGNSSSSSRRSSDCGNKDKWGFYASARFRVQAGGSSAWNEQGQGLTGESAQGGASSRERARARQRGVGADEGADAGTETTRQAMAGAVAKGPVEILYIPDAQMLWLLSSGMTRDGGVTGGSGETGLGTQAWLTGVAFALETPTMLDAPRSTARTGALCPMMHD